MPHSAFQGQTPDEVSFGIGDEVTKRLSEARDSAREKRMKESRAEGCGKCVGDTASRRRYFDGRGPKCCDTQLPAVAGSDSPEPIAQNPAESRAVLGLHVSAL